MRELMQIILLLSVSWIILAMDIAERITGKKFKIEYWYVSKYIWRD